MNHWDDYWMHSDRSNNSREYVASSHLFWNGELRALIEFNGTAQRHFYTASRGSIELPGQFASLEAAKAAVEDEKY